MLHTNALEKLDACDFLGNTRVLRNILERAILMADGETIIPKHITMEFMKSQLPEKHISQAIIPLEQAEKQYLQWTASQFECGRRALTIKLSIIKRILYRKLQN